MLLTCMLFSLLTHPILFQTTWQVPTHTSTYASLVHGYWSRFLYCTNGTKSLKALQINFSYQRKSLKPPGILLSIPNMSYRKTWDWPGFMVCLRMRRFARFCAVCTNEKTWKNTHAGVLLLAKLQASSFQHLNDFKCSPLNFTTSNTPPFFTFFKSYK